VVNDKKDVKLNEGFLMENLVRFRISSADKEKIRSYFGSFSAMRDYVLEVIENKGENVKREAKKK